jgi:putative membrane protein
MVGRHVKLADADRTRLRQAIKAGEARSSAELVLVVADSCGGYSLFAVLWPALAALAVGGVAAFAFPQITGPRLFLTEAGVFILLVVVLQWSPALLRVVPHHYRRAHAQQTAEHQFALRVQERTQGRTGVLLLVALAERQVFILPDTGISTVIEATVWQGVIDRLIAAIRTGPPVEAMIDAIERIVVLLEQHFPPSASSRNTVCDDVVELAPGSATEATGNYAAQPPR